MSEVIKSSSTPKGFVPPTTTTPKGETSKKSSLKTSTKKSSTSTPTLTTNEVKVLDIIKKSPKGITLKDLEVKSGLRYRVIHNLTWRLEGGPKDGNLTLPKHIQRVNVSRGVLYAPLKRGQSKDPNMSGKYATRGSV